MVVGLLERVLNVDGATDIKQWGDVSGDRVDECHMAVMVVGVRVVSRRALWCGCEGGGKSSGWGGGVVWRFAVAKVSMEGIEPSILSVLSSRPNH
jgi:hypothetical protein